MRSWIVQHRLQVGGLLVALCLVIAATLSRVGGDDTSDRAAGVGAPIPAPAVTAAVDAGGSGAETNTARVGDEGTVGDSGRAAGMEDPDRLRLPVNPSGARDLRTREGVRQAGIDYASTVQQRLVYLDDQDGTAMLSAWRASGVESAAVAADVESASVLREALAAGGGSVWWSVSPIGAEVSTFSQDRARVSVWVMQVVGSSVDPIEGGTAFVPTVDFQTVTIDFVWDTAGGWSVWEATGTAGPVPMLAPTAVQSAPSEFFAALAGHTLVQEHR